MVWVYVRMHSARNGLVNQEKASWKGWRNVLEDPGGCGSISEGIHGSKGVDGGFCGEYVRR